jgi:antitoxin component of MazEF toxin-antitoxin module
MKTRLVKVGNEWAVMLPDQMVVQAGLLDEVEVQTQGNSISILQAEWNPRLNWDEAFRAEVLNGRVAMAAGEW